MTKYSQPIRVPISKIRSSHLVNIKYVLDWVIPDRIGGPPLIAKVPPRFIIVDRKGEVIDGIHYLAALKLMNIEEVWVQVVY